MPLLAHLLADFCKYTPLLRLRHAVAVPESPIASIAPSDTGGVNPFESFELLIKLGAVVQDPK